MSRSGHQVSQNVDNFIRDKPSTRLHAPPGGGSSVGSLIFGGGGAEESPFAGHERRHSLNRRKDEVPEQVNPYGKQAQHQQQQYQAQPAYNAAPTYNAAPAYNAAPSYQAPAAGVGRQSSSNQYATGSNQNAGNVLTDRRITRIHAPPGGASSFRLG
ncbi:hypothetical protein Poli38472_006005 [Pythium oligandrum]|uniref:Uncharacterized protein n=1 Tax=Pythium oligandrum TaxID=41045 RepID=A0A8K1FR22_PYTOL|nr:hypothetical protein Poli38472_006005 [Pythium oligandrum]|eukprot:TMW68537.1 hypothetical protein Poli38472_006005 [Pythium oligandrum]